MNSKRIYSIHRVCLWIMIDRIFYFYLIGCMIEPLIKLNCGDLDHKHVLGCFVSDLNYKIDSEDGKWERIEV